MFDGEDSILFNVETGGGYGESISSMMPQISDENILQSNDKWLGTNFIWVLTSVIVMIMIPVALMTYKEEIDKPIESFIGEIEEKDD